MFVAYKKLCFSSKLLTVLSDKAKTLHPEQLNFTFSLCCSKYRVLRELTEIHLFIVLIKI